MTTLPTWRMRTWREAAAGTRGNMPEGLQPHQVMATVAVVPATAGWSSQRGTRSTTP